MDQKTVLIVEDEKALRDALNNKLNSLGISCVEAEDGEAGLAAALKNKPDLILLDIMMPKMNGGEMLKKLRVDEWGSQVPVIILTNVTYLEDKATKEQSSEYFLKVKTDISEIAEKIKKYLE